MTLYPIDLYTADTSTLNQLRLEAEVKYALLEDYDRIIDSQSRIFVITEDDSKITLTEIPEDSEDNTETYAEDEECDDFNEELERMTSSELIEEIIHNSLLSVDPITFEQAQTMLVLANLKVLLKAE